MSNESKTAAVLAERIGLSQEAIAQAQRQLSALRLNRLSEIAPDTQTTEAQVAAAIITAMAAQMPEFRPRFTTCSTLAGSAARIVRPEALRCAGSRTPTSVTSGGCPGARSSMT